MPPTHAIQPNQTWFFASIAQQTLTLVKSSRAQQCWPISSSRYGTGNKEGSNQTPLGWHCIADRIGAHAPLGAIFKARKNTGEVCVINSDKERDIIATRILWLAGLEPGVNHGAGIDSYQRYIYIHGTHDEAHLGTPASIGCLRMANRDVTEVYDCAYDTMPILIA